jgi:hypothetical protein
LKRERDQMSDRYKILGLFCGLIMSFSLANWSFCNHY